MGVGVGARRLGVGGVPRRQRVEGERRQVVRAVRREGGHRGAAVPVLALPLQVGLALALPVQGQLPGAARRRLLLLLLLPPAAAAAAAAIPPVLPVVQFPGSPAPLRELCPSVL